MSVRGRIIIACAVVGALCGVARGALHGRVRWGAIAGAAMIGFCAGLAVAELAAPGSY